jgi:hypothetical protein
MNSEGFAFARMQYLKRLKYGWCPLGHGWSCPTCRAEWANLQLKKSGG